MMALTLSCSLGLHGLSEVIVRQWTACLLTPSTAFHFIASSKPTSRLSPQLQHRRLLVTWKHELRLVVAFLKEGVGDVQLISMRF